MSCLSDFIDGVATVEVLQRWRRLDLAEKWRALENSSAQVYGGERHVVFSWFSLPTFYMRRLGLRIVLQDNYVQRW
jgi:hypothetical protein